MGYRGSKSGILPVKEQRVDGSWFLNKNLRCTLKGCVSSYQVKILFKQLNNKNFSTLVQSNFTNLNPWFVSGFTYGEGSFCISIYIDNRIKGRISWAVKPSFQISLNSKDINLLLQLKEFCGCGIIVNKKTRN
jgi:hypothetical protein